ncbi:MAG: hypothetical protein V4670_08595 [Bacteroidota bacterium]
MIKKIILGSLFLFSLHTIAQEGTASPYSFHGIGEVKFKGTIENRSMGGLGILNDSIHINLQNPAALSSLKLTTFAVAGTFSPTKLKNDTETQKAQRTTLDYLSMAFPAGKLVVNLGLMPYSAVGYKIVSNTGTESYKYDGTGGVNKAFVGAGYQLNKKISFGAEIAYNFGKIERNVAFFGNDLQNGINELNKSEIGGLSLNSGLIYKTKIKNYNFVSSLSFAPSAVLNSNNLRQTGTLSVQGSTIVLSNVTEDDVPNTKLRLPSKLSIGTGIGDEKKWFVGTEISLLSKGDLDVDLNDEAVYEKGSKFSLGGYFTPKYNSFSNYFDRITYRAGLRYEKTGLVVRNESIKDQALTLGLGFPLGGTFSNINLGFELGKKGTTNAGLVQENYMNFSVGLSFNDRWFVKRKFD